MKKFSIKKLQIFRQICKYLCLTLKIWLENVEKKD